MKARIGFVLVAFAVISGPSIADTPAKPDMVMIKAQNDFAAARRCQKEGYVYMLRMSATEVALMMYPLAKPEYESSFPFKTCDAIVERGVLHVEAIRKNSR